MFERGSIFMFGLVPFGSRRDLAAGEKSFDRLFDVFNEPFFHNFDMGMTQGFKVDVEDKGNAYELTADLPGMKKEDISLNYENSYLTISAKKETSSEEKDKQGNFIRRERSTGSMTRSFYIDGIDVANVDASFKDGVLTIVMPKVEKTKRISQIEIK